MEEKKVTLESLQKEISTLKKQQKVDTDKQKRRSLNNRVRIFAVVGLIIWIGWWVITEVVFKIEGFIWFN